MEDLVKTSDFSDCSAQGIFLEERRESGKPLPFPCYTLASAEKTADAVYSLIDYPDVLKMVFEAETIIS